jgi:hypothetical protein
VLDTKTGRLWQQFQQSGRPTDWTELKTPWMEATGK